MTKEIMQTAIAVIITALITTAGNMFISSKLQEQKQEFFEKQLEEVQDDLEKLSGSNGALFGKISNIEGKLELIIQELKK